MDDIKNERKEVQSLFEGLSNHIRFIYNQNCKPISIIFDIDRQKLIIEYDHDKFIEIFGDLFRIDEIQQYGKSFILERIISILDIIILLKVNISEIEMINKKLSKIYTN
jgi:hypothetical protein